MAFQTRRVAIIGAGHVGSHCALSLAMTGECDELILIDADKPKASSQALDLADAASGLPHRLRVCAGDWADCKNADIAIVTAGTRTKIAQPRTDMLAGTCATVRQVTRSVMDSGFSGIFLVVSDPCDPAAYCVWQESGLPASRVIATGTLLDSARLRRILSQILCVDIKSIHGYVLGEHGESQMVPWSNITVGGKRLLDLMSERPDTFGRIDLTEVAQQVRNTAWSIMGGKRVTEFGVSMATTELVRAIFHNERRVLPVSTLLEGAYGQHGIFAGVPAIIDQNGVAEVLEIELTDAERGDFAASCEAIRYYTGLSQNV